MANTQVGKAALGVLIALVVIAGMVAFCFIYQGSSSTGKVWLAGAAALGLVSGFTTGASKETGAGTEFLKFLSGGILAPLLGGVVTLLQFRQETRETYAYEEGQLTLKSTAIVLPPEYSHIHPLWVLGGFFVTYGLCAILGMLIGMAIRTQLQLEINVKA